MKRKMNVKNDLKRPNDSNEIYFARGYVLNTDWPPAELCQALDIGPRPCVSRAVEAAPIDQLIGRANAGYFSLPSAILAGHTVTCLPSCH